MVDPEKCSYFLRYANRMTVKELKEYSKKLLSYKNYSKIQDMNKKGEIIDNIVLSMFDMRYNTPLRLKHDYITGDIIEEVESLDYISDVEIIENTRIVRIIDSKPYFYLGSVNYFAGKDLPKTIKKYHKNILVRGFYRYLTSGYDIYISRNDRYVPYKR